MAVQDELPETAEVAVVDPFSLYRIAVGHTADGRALGEATRAGAVRLVTPAVAFAVACAMRTCWDELCDRDHRDGTGVPVRRFQELGGTEVVGLSPAETLSAGRLYAASLDRRVEGAEVLAACHAAVLATALKSPLVSVARAAYCYSALRQAGVHLRIDLV
ncbi:hypothetical protein [Streptomyces sp. CRN 30]|uniref:hypothetical protein n=1 Tax=Streptomyces sp. CRN 30 TaxID=3075613 RepID=UPI002A80F934|nr:hypothetical protein [Streptomyces sp. CRN 30]